MKIKKQFLILDPENEADAEVFKKLEKNKSSAYMGFLYIIEWGENIKIGCSKSPRTRYAALKRQAEKYGKERLRRIAISDEHTNYFDSEKIAHEIVSEHRLDSTELFSLSLESAIDRISGKLYLLDQSNEINTAIGNSLAELQRVTGLSKDAVPCDGRGVSKEWEFLDKLIDSDLFTVLAEIRQERDKAKELKREIADQEEILRQLEREKARLATS